VTPLAEVRLEEVNGALVAHLAGEVDLSNVEVVRATIIDRVSAETDALVLDLSETTYLDSTGVRLLFELTQRLHARRRQLRLVVTDAALVRRVILLTKLDEQVPLHDSVEDALAALQSPDGSDS
jgi:anti-anti-sigma factor